MYIYSLFEFIVYGLHYVFPAVPEGPVNGIPTAVSHPIMHEQFESSQVYVWPDIDGNDYGLSIAPLYREVAKAAKIDSKLYTLLALIDVLRIGRVRERNYGVTILKQMILNV